MSFENLVSSQTETISQIRSYKNQTLYHMPAQFIKRIRIFQILEKQLIVPGFNLKSGVNFIITGEGSKLFNLEKYSINFFGKNVSKKDKNNYEKNDNLRENFTSCLGALKIIKDGWETEAIPELREKNTEKIGFFAKIFGSRI